MGDKTPHFLESKFLYFIGFLSLVFPKKSYTALVTNFKFPELLPQNCHPILKILDLPLARAIYLLSKNSDLK